jgi:ABC-2 type transport system permease protein
MTTATPSTRPPRGRADALAGARTLLAVALRRDRRRIAAWAAVYLVLTVGVASSWDRLYPTSASRLELARTLELDPSLTALLGPLFDPLGTGGLTAWRTMAGSLLALGLVVAFVVVRHTRAEEQEGRAEIVMAGTVGRAARMAAALLLALVYVVVVVVVVTLAMLGLGLPLGGTLAYASAAGLGAFVYAGVAGITAQLAHTSRSANGLAGLVLGIGFTLTAYGNGQPSGSVWTWLSPFGWAEQTRAFADERWWLLAVPVLVAAVSCAVALVLAAERDLGASLLPDRAGRAGAAPWVRSPAGLAWRLDRGWLLGWVVATALMGASVGFLLTSSLDVVAANPALSDVIVSLGGTDVLADAFVVVMVGIFALSSAAYGIATVMRLRSEETSGRAENVWTATSTRVQWLAGHTTTALVGATLLLAVGGLCLGATFGAGSADAVGTAWRSALAALVTAPAVWLLVALPVALLGLRPRLAGIGWIALGWCVLVGWFGAVLGLPEWLARTAPTGQVPLWPAQPMRWLPVVVLTVLAVALLAAGAIGVRRRDLPS